jgi:hypothetical protein
MPRLLAITNFDDCLAANAFDFATANSIVLILLDPLKVGGDDLKLQTGTPRVQDQNVHWRLSLLSVGAEVGLSASLKWKEG